MKINFTKKDYRLLVTMIEIADWIMNAHHASERPNTGEYRDLRHLILSYTKEMGMGDCYKKEGDEYYETREYEENSEQMKFIEEYNDEIFWEELISRLADRDYEQKYGNEPVDFETRIKRFSKLENLYINEINEFGIENLNFSKDKGKKKVH